MDTTFHNDDLIKFPYFADTTERGIGGERRRKDRVTLQITPFDSPYWSQTVENGSGFET